MSAAVTTQMTQRLIKFGLTTAAREWVTRLTQADQASEFAVPSSCWSSRPRSVASVASRGSGRRRVSFPVKQTLR